MADITLPDEVVADETESMNHGTDNFSKAEIGKDAIQDGVSAAANTVSEVTTIITHAVTDVMKAVGGLATEIFEIRDGARKAAAAQKADGDGE